MKKSILLSSLLILTFVSPVFAKKAPKKNVEVAEDDSIVQVAIDGKEKETEKLDQEDAELDMRIFKSWKKVNYKKIDKTYGKVRVRVLPRRGTFNIGVVNEAGKTIPVLSNHDEYTSSYFSLKAGKKIYKLAVGANIKTKARATDELVQIIYSVDEVADVLVEMRPVESVEGNGYDMLKITATVTNTGKKNVEFALKNVMDTVLGEADLYHFYTSEDIPVKSELCVRTMKNAKYFNSKNSAAWAQFLLYGGDVTPIDIVALANYETVDTTAWVPEMSSYRTFDTVTSYNNSAVGIIWPGVKVSPEASADFTYYMAFASDEEIPSGYEYVSNSGKVPASSVPVVVDDVPVVEEVTVAKPAKKPAPVTKPAEKPVVKAEEKADENTAVQKPASDEPADDLENNIPSEILSTEYLQSLLNRIEMLETSNASLNRDEIRMLNEELDFVLSLMRKQ